MQANPPGKANNRNNNERAKTMSDSSMLEMKNRLRKRMSPMGGSVENIEELKSQMYFMTSNIEKHE